MDNLNITLSSVDNSDGISSSIETRESVPSCNISAHLHMANRFCLYKSQRLPLPLVGSVKLAHADA